MTDLNKVVRRELEFLQADLELLRQEVDSINHSMKQVELWQRTMDMTLRRM